MANVYVVQSLDSIVAVVNDTPRLVSKNRSANDKSEHSDDDDDEEEEDGGGEEEEGCVVGGS